MKNRYIKLLYCVLPLLSWGCREIYDPEIKQEELEILVVEGHIEVEGGVSEVKLSYTSPVFSDEASFQNIPNGEVFVEYQSPGGEFIQFPMQRDQLRNYVLDTYLDSEQEYRLNINIAEKGRYLSDWIKPQISPPIDSVGFSQNEDENVEIYLNTKGDENAQYFIWNFEETWIFNTPVISLLKYVRLSETRDTIVARTPDEMTDQCFLSEKSNKVVIGSSGQYQDQIIYQREIQEIPFASEKLGRRYSILVQQRAIPKEAYDFYEILRKNADDIGGIFSPLPSNLSSNIHHESNDEIKAIGYVTVGTSVDKRIYIGRHEISNWRVNIPFYAGCEFSVDTVEVQYVTDNFNNNYRVPVSALTANDPRIILGYLGSSRKCTDCTLRGQKETPDFWEY